MRVNLPSWLTALRTVSAAQLKAMYDAIAAVVNGNLGRENFARRADIANANKAAKRSWFVLEGQLAYPFAGDGGYGNAGLADTGPSVLRWKVPQLAPGNRKGTIKVGHWSAYLGDNNGVPGITAGNVKLRHTVALTGDTAEKASVAIPNGTKVARLFGDDIVEFEVAEGDILEVQVQGVAFGGGGTKINRFGAAVWLRMDHLP